VIVGKGQPARVETDLHERQAWKPPPGCTYCGTTDLLIHRGFERVCIWCSPSHPPEEVHVKVPEKGVGGDFVPCPAGTQNAVCVDVIEIKDVEKEFGGKKWKEDQYKFVFQVEKTLPDGKRFVVSTFGMKASLHEKAKLRSFLEAWRSYCLTAHAGSPWMFPGVSPTKAAPIDFTRSLNLAAEAIGSPSNRFQQTRRTAHALRGYYVSVRRDAGVPDALIAAELGQGGGDTLVRTTYGAPDAFASGRLDWMPREGIEPAWSVLRSDTANVVAFQAAS